MRIVLTVHQFLPDFGSGTEVLTFETARELQQRGHHVTVFAAYPTQTLVKDADRRDRYSYQGVQVERFQYNRVPMGGQTNLVEMEYDNHLVRACFKEYLKQEKPDVVHFFHLLHLSASPVDACHELGIPMVLTPTDFWFMCPTVELRWPGNQTCPGPSALGINCIRHMAALSQPPRVNALIQRLPTRLLRLFILSVKRWGTTDGEYFPFVRALVDRQKFLQERINLIDKVIVPTRLMLSKLGENGLEARRTVMIPFGINLDYLKNAKRPEPSHILRLGLIGTLKEHKGVHVLLHAVRALAGKPIQLKIYGKVNELSGYVRNLKKMSMDDPRIQFCGTFPNADIGRIFSGLDALVVPSLWHENSPLVIYSAQAARCPVIASNMAGMSEVIQHRKNGLLFEAGNVPELATAIDTLLREPHLLQQLSANAIQPPSIQEYAAKLVEIYRPLIAGETAR